MKLTDLISVKQNKDESVSEYVKRFKETKNRCFDLSISEVDLADIAYKGLRSSIRDRLEGRSFLSVSQLQTCALLQEHWLKNIKDTPSLHRSNVHIVDSESDSSDDETKDVYAAEFV